MDTVITVTSKNQVTLPAKVVKKLDLGPGRKLLMRERGSQIILEPQGDLLTRMQKHWPKVKVKRPLSDEELKQAIRDSVVIAWNKQERQGRHGR